MTKPSPLRANVYFDGFNFYNGCFHNRDREDWKPYKWLNPRLLIESVFPHFTIGQIRYFTALVHPERDDPDNRHRQQAYIRALETVPNLTVHYGRFATNKKIRLAADESSRSPVPKHPVERVAVIEQEEKGSDVNLASYLLVDGFQDAYDIAVIVSNDSDLATPITLARSVLRRRVALLNPRPKTALDLRGKADSHRIVRLGPIQAAQFPPVIMDEHGVITKPSSW